MILDTTYRQKSILQQISAEIGRPYSFIKSIRKGGSGSRRLLIQEVSEHLKSYIHENHHPTYSSIELRPKGIIVHMVKVMKVTSWIIPYYKLSIYKTNTIAIHADGHFVRFKKTNDAVHLKFIKKLLTEKANYIKMHSMD